MKSSTSSNMKNLSLKPRNLLSICLLLLQPQHAFAQIGGVGAHGANLRVTALGGYGGIQTKYKEPEDFQINYDDTEVGSGYRDDYESHRSRPDLYVGSRYETRDGQGRPAGAGEVDAGVSWVETYPTDARLPYAKRYWKCYLRIDGGIEDPLPQRDDTGQPIVVNNKIKTMQIARGQLGTFTCKSELKIVNGKSGVRLDVINENGTADWGSTWAEANLDIPANTVTHQFPANSNTAMSVKRVIAITQNNLKFGLPNIKPLEGRTDLQPKVGSKAIYVLGAQVISCQIAKLNFAPGGGGIATYSYGPMSGAVTKRHIFLPNGRNAPGTGNPPPYVFDLRAPHQRPAAENQPPANNPNGEVYDAETVDIKLLPAPPAVAANPAHLGQ